MDAGASDAATPDDGGADAGPGLHDGGTRDGETPDAGVRDAGARDAGPADAGPPFDEVVFRATHNSYEGGPRRSVPEQLAGGVRFLELDIHDNDYESLQRYRVGHDAPGDRVETGGGNPASVVLDDWLERIASWSAEHPGHAPITIGLDLKDDMTDNPSYRAGNLAALGADLEDAFGDRLFVPAEAASGWPGIGAMRGRVLAVLSGHTETRELYVRDRGANPAVAIDSRGRVVEVHDSGTGTLWYWTGQYQPDGRIVWHRHGRYDTGQTPAVALNDDGWLVEVHQSESAATLWYHVGRLDADYEITWTDSREYDTGVRPTVRFVDGSDTALREVHRSETTGEHWFWDATLDTTGERVEWGAHDTTSDPLFDFARASAGGRSVQVRTGRDGEAPSDTLLYSTGDGGDGRIRYRQIAFVEMQLGNPADLARELFAIGSGALSIAEGWRRDGGIVRIWGFGEGDTAVSPPVQFPATDTPFAAWYEEYARSVGAVE